MHGKEPGAATQATGDVETNKTTRHMPPAGTGVATKKRQAQEGT